eukprot:6210225-Pleurochrysis_carterae.AAC.2
MLPAAMHQSDARQACMRGGEEGSAGRARGRLSSPRLAAAVSRTLPLSSTASLIARRSSA